MNPKSSATRHPSAGPPKQAKAPKSTPKNPGAEKPVSAAPKRHLKIAPKPPRKFRKLFIAGTTLGLLGLVAIPFVIVFIHASLLTGQRDLDHLRQERNAQLELRQQLLFDRSLAVAPQRIITIARDQLGMVPAEKIVYLQPAVTPASPPVSVPAQPTP